MPWKPTRRQQQYVMRAVCINRLHVVSSKSLKECIEISSTAAGGSLPQDSNQQTAGRPIKLYHINLHVKILADAHNPTKLSYLTVDPPSHPFPHFC